MIELLFDDSNVQSALDYLLNKGDTCGYDGITTQQLPEYLKLNKDVLFGSILDGSYHPGYVTQFEIVNKKGKSRTVSKYNSVDRFVAQLVYQVIYPVIDPLMVDESYAYQKGKSVLSAVQKSREHILDGYKFVITVDFNDYFGSIDHALL